MTSRKENIAIAVCPMYGGNAAVTAERHTGILRHEETIRRIVLLSALYLVAGFQALVPLIDPDIWWHLRTGQWIVEHATVPTTDPFSSYGMGKPWVAYSWLFEVLVYGVHHTFGLMGILLYTVAMSFMIALALHRLVRRYCLPFLWEVALVALGLVALKPLISPRPWLFTILFFILELDILLTTRRTGDLRRLLFLLPLFLLWVNVHIQFVYGLFILGVFAIEPFVEQLLRGSPFVKGSAVLTAAAPRFAVLCGCVAVTLLTPYHLDLYRAALGLMAQQGPFSVVNELQALSFRALWDWFIVGAILGATFCLGWQRERTPFFFLLLIPGILLALRSGRDTWFATVVAVALMGEVFSQWARGQRDIFLLSTFRRLVIAGIIIVTLLVVSHIRNLSESFLETKLATVYPVVAAAEVEARRYSGPLYNHFNWGGYLIWRLPHLAVSMDGRTNIHGDERILRSRATWGGEGGWASDPELAAARLVIAFQSSALTSLLRLDPRFELVHEDPLAAVFVAAPPPDHDAIVPKDMTWQSERLPYLPSSSRSSFLVSNSSILMHR